MRSENPEPYSGVTPESPPERSREVCRWRHLRRLLHLGAILLAGGALAGLATVTPVFFTSAQHHMVLIPAGWFILGNDSGDIDEAPAQRVYLPAYFIGRTEVTNREYREYDPSHSFPEGEEEHPVTNLSWNEAQGYAHWAGKRLPTEWEWEKAARGRNGRRYPWGKEYQPKWANTHATGLGRKTQVGTFPLDISPFGVMDTVGNAAEWTASWYTPYLKGDVNNPDYGKFFKVVRGTSWDGDFDCDGRTAFRNFARPGFRHRTIGFRVAQNAE